MAIKLEAGQLLNADNYIGPPVKKTIKWQRDGESFEADVFVRKLSYRNAVDDMAAMELDDRLARRVALCICDETGQPIMTAADVTGTADPSRGPMCRELFIALVNVVGEVNEFSVKTKRQRRSKSSGTN